MRVLAFHRQGGILRRSGRAGWLARVPWRHTNTYKYRFDRRAPLAAIVWHLPDTLPPNALTGRADQRPLRRGAEALAGLAPLRAPLT